jgi:hypothetical protein
MLFSALTDMEFFPLRGCHLASLHTFLAKHLHIYGLQPTGTRELGSHYCAVAQPIITEVVLDLA